MGRKLIIKERRLQPQSVDLSIIPTLDSLVSDAMSVIGSELAYYRAKTTRGQRLDLKEAKAIRDYVDALVKLSKEAREAARSQDLSNLTNEELLQLALQITSNRPTTLAGEKVPETSEETEE